MFESITRIVLFAVGVTITMSTLVIGQIGFLVISASRAAIFVMLVWSMFILAFEGRRYPRDNRLIWAVLFYVAVFVSLLSALFGGDSAKVVFIGGIQMVAAVAFAFLVSFVVSSRPRLDALLTGYLVSVIATSLSVLTSTQIGRTGGYGGDPNHMALEASLALPIAGLFFLTKQRRKILWRIFLATVVVLVVLGIMASVSRSAIVGVIAMFGLWMLRFRRFDILRYVIPAGALLGLVVFYASPEWTERMSTMTSEEGIEGDSSIMSRFQQTVYAFYALADNPAIGVGYGRFGSFAVEHRRYLRHSDPEAGQDAELLKSGSSIHNAYLSVMAEMGLFGLITFLTYCVLTWKQLSSAWLLARRVPGDSELTALYFSALFLQMALLTMYVGSVFMPSIHWKSLWMLFGLSLSVLEMTQRRYAQLQVSAAAPETEVFGNADNFGVPALESQGSIRSWADFH